MELELRSQTAHARPGRPPLLFVHGGFHAAWCWAEHYLPFFAERGWAAHALSLRGHGRSAGPEALREASLDDYVEDVLQVVETLGAPTILLGHSMGGAVAERCWVRRPDAIAGLALLAGSPLRPAVSVVARMLRTRPVDTLLGMMRGDSARMRRAMAPFFLSKEMPPDERDAIEDRLDLESPRAMRELFRRDPIRRPEGDARPVLVVAAVDDVTIPIAAHEAARARLEAEILRVPGAHDLMLDPRWRDGAEAVEGWLARRFDPERDHADAGDQEPPAA